jgi:deoxyadenosine/deoxycytidine kinase
MKDLKISISGTIGVGKTSIMEHFSKVPNCATYKEDINKELLELYYKKVNSGEDARRIEKLNQYHFLNETIVREIHSYESDAAPVKFYDRNMIEHSHIFAKTSLPYRDWLKLVGMQEQLLTDFGFEEYDLAIILTCDFEENMARVRKRGRDNGELDLDIERFKQLSDMYKSDGFKETLTHYSKLVWVIDTTGKTNEEVCGQIQDMIDRKRRVI